MKRIRVMLGFLVLGAIVNVAIVYAFACTNLTGTYIERGIGFQYDELGVFWSVSNYRAPGTFRSESFWSDSHVCIHSEDIPEKTALEVVPSWASYIVPDTIPKAHATRIALAYGWPMLAMWAGYETNEIGSLVHVRTGHIPHFDQQRRLTFQSQRVLPIAILWMGFTVNTFFFAASSWLLIPGPFALRKHFRHKRGLCVKCAYDLKGAEHEVCPECGATIGKVVSA